MPFHSTTIFTLAHLFPLSPAHLPQQKHNLNLLSSKSNLVYYLSWITNRFTFHMKAMVYRMLIAICGIYTFNPTDAEAEIFPICFICIILFLASSNKSGPNWANMKPWLPCLPSQGKFKASSIASDEIYWSTVSDRIAAEKTQRDTPLSGPKTIKSRYIVVISTQNVRGPKQSGST